MVIIFKLERWAANLKEANGWTSPYSKRQSLKLRQHHHRALRVVAAMATEATGCTLVAGFAEVSPERVNRRKGYRSRDFEHPGGLDRPRHPEAAVGQLLLRLAARAPPATPTGRRRSSLRLSTLAAHDCWEPPDGPCPAIGRGRTLSKDPPSLT